MKRFFFRSKRNNLMDYNGRGYNWYRPVLESVLLSITCKHVCSKSGVFFCDCEKSEKSDSISVYQPSGLHAGTT